MEENILTWNVTNWVTVVLMAFLGFGILALVSKLVKGQGGSRSDQMPAG